jgi:hypothetical protein
MKTIKTIYSCDFCEKDLKENDHISIWMGPYAGIVKSPEWRNIKKIETRPYQFCDIDHCLTGFLFHNCTKKEIQKNNKKNK